MITGNMKIAVIDDAGFGLTGGHGIFGKEVYSELLARVYQDYLGYEVIRILLGKGLSESNNVIKLKGSRIPVLRTLHDTSLASDFVKVLRDEKIKLMHINILNDRYVYPITKASKENKIPYIVTCHDWIFLCPTHWRINFSEMQPCNIKAPNIKCLKCAYSLSKRFNKPLYPSIKGFYQIISLRKLLINSSAVISPSQFFAEELKKYFGITVYHIPNPVNPEILAEEPCLDGEGYALFIGRLEYEKGAHLLPEIAKKITPIELHVVGQGNLEKLLRDLKISKMVFHGYVSYKKKIELLKKASVVVVPSVWMEMYGYTILEAFAHAKPVVAFGLGGPGELIKNSGSNLLAKPYNLTELCNHILKLIDRRDLAIKIGLNVRNYLQRVHSPITYAKKLNEIIKNLV